MSPESYPAPAEELDVAPTFQPDPEVERQQGFIHRIAQNALARCVLIGSMAFGLATSVGSQEAHAISSGEPQITYDVATGNYPYMNAESVPSGDSEYTINGNDVNPTSTYSYRNCTDYAWERVRQEFGEAKAQSIEGWGDAQSWDDAAGHDAAFNVDVVPEAGDLAIWDPYEKNPHGHVAFVESVNPDGSVNIAEFNKTKYGFYGEFSRRGAIYPGTDGSVDRANSTIHETVRADHYIDLNGPNSNDFKLKMYAAGTKAPLSVNERTARATHDAEVATAKANKALLATIPDNGVIRGDNGAWYIRKGDTLQWVVTGDTGAKAIGLDKKRVNATKHYSEALIHTQEEGYTYPYTQRDKDYAAGKFGSRVSMTITNTQMTTVAKQLGFDSAKVIVTEGAKGWRFVKAGKQYSVNMDLVAMMATGRTDIFSYPTDWKGPTSWRAYTFKSGSERADYFRLPFADTPLAKYLSITDLPNYGKRLSYLNAAYAGASCLTPGTVCGWGSDTPIGEIVGRPYLPATLAEFTDVKGVAGTNNNGYVVKRDGTVWAWGSSLYGGLGNGQHEDVTINQPVKVDITNVKTVVAAAAAYALKEDGSVWVWGQDGQARGILGDGKEDTGQVYDRPVQVVGLSGVSAITASHTNVYALKQDGTVWAWGLGQSGGLGIGSIPNTGYTSSPVQVKGLTGIKAIAAGSNNGYALKNDGTVVSWGYGFLGGIGNGPANANVLAPVTVAGLNGVKGLAAKSESFSSSVYALKSDGTVMAWGEGSHGELGTGGLANRNRPVAVKGLGDISILGTNEWAAYGIQKDGTVWAWGKYGAGGIFDRADNITTPTMVTGLSARSIAGTYAVVG